jgi:hypothetical protein
MVIKGQDVDNIALGDTLTEDADGVPGPKRPLKPSLVCSSST